MKKLRHLLVVCLLVVVPVVVMTTACAPLTADQIAADGGDPLKEAENSFLQWIWNTIYAPILAAVLPHEPA